MSIPNDLTRLSKAICLALSLLLAELGGADEVNDQLGALKKLKAGTCLASRKDIVTRHLCLRS